MPRDRRPTPSAQSFPTPTAARLAAATAAVIVAAAPVRAATCVDDPVFASGEPASYEWLARIKAHANWRAKVRSIPALGDPYANWKRANDTTERCIAGPEGTVCTFKGRPCRKD